MLTAGLTDRVVTESSRVFCPGSTVIYGRRFRCWRPQGHGWMDARGALKHSCDVYFYHLGKNLGIERIAHYARLFGLESPTGIDLADEKRGLVPDAAWSLRVRKTKWYPGETISVAIGQGPVLVTPMQMAVMMAMVANGGEPVVPHLVKGAAPRPRPRVALDPHALQVVREGLWAVVNQPGGTAHWSSYVPGLDMAGKTGTAQVVALSARTKNESLPFRFRDHAWFASFAPLADPRLVVVVFAEHGGGGSRTAAPIAKAVHEKYFAPDLQRLAAAL
jgi:penicillin-binding protein 2